MGENRRGYEAGDRHPHKSRERQPVRGQPATGTTISTQPSPAEICRSTRESFFLTWPKDSGVSFVSPRECPEISWHNGLWVGRLW
jgi:hypothetical protein